MFKPLPQDFQMEMYGLTVRLVKEEDADFILQLRTDPEKSKFIHHTDSDIAKHLEWFKKYKIRESEGRDYYFIYLKDGKPVGVNRIYNIHEYYGTPGSWICSKDNDLETTMATSILLREIAFNKLGLDLMIFDVRKGNKKVWRMHKMWGSLQIGESEIDYFFSLSKESFLRTLPKMKEMFNF